MQYLLFSLLISLFTAAGAPAESMTCAEVKEVAETVMDSGLKAEDKLWILDGLIKNHGSGCNIVYGDAKAN